MERVFWAHYSQCLPCSYPDRSGDLDSVITLSAFYTRRQLHAHPMWACYNRAYGIEHELIVCLPAAPGRTRRVLLARGPADRDFADADRLMLRLLRPHLHAALPNTARPGAAARLTPREWQVLRHVAAGHRNAEIADALFVSVTTVRKHLENIFGKLGVHTRTAALAAVRSSI